MAYVACYLGDGGVMNCGHDHATIRDAMQCLRPGGFVRAKEEGVLRSLDDDEVRTFITEVRAGGLDK